MAYQNSNRGRLQDKSKGKIDLWALQNTLKTQGRMITHLSRSYEMLKGLVDLLRDEVADLTEIVEQKRKPWWKRWLKH
ncbi:hypothetical protein [Pasteurella bettyae]|uniref:Uncharacterized protein n=1 Tax=Pasteurella bettyae CCUG 2042 TaxID=1095749 RepID=I3DKA6_9PAST|nr:hypothetical protein [Pasteurella bettyae]EIJ72149.1 hypothetical protein HMPREF1052_2050 [Pasteurella bettyae CCUG 2042]SUB20783.1 Uncharacterised protein [Pasteurella bettyae]